eukprot:SAG22_NODE_23752_length_135_cov_15.361111_1_plen_37_part_10
MISDDIIWFPPGFVSGGIMPLMRSTSSVSQNYLNDYS